MSLIFRTLPSLLRRLRTDRSGLALMEFGFTLPIVLTIGGYGVELSYLSVSNLRVSQAAVNLADNASRVGLLGAANVSQLREADINDVLQGTRLENAAIGLTEFGRITLTSLENVRQAQDTTRVQRIHWQRCIGRMSGTGYDSRWGPADVADGTTTDTATNFTNQGVDVPTGIGGINAPNDSGVMVVEVNYRYRPLFRSLFVSEQIIRYTQSFVVRDNRDFTRIYNPAPAATASTCNLNTLGPGGVNT
jgi:Flp pilus assembly protein TadG